MCSFRLYGIIPSHPHDPEEYPCQGGRTARLNRGMSLGGLAFPQQEYHSQLHTTYSIPGYRRSRSARASAPTSCSIGRSSKGTADSREGTASQSIWFSWLYVCALACSPAKPKIAVSSAPTESERRIMMHTEIALANE